MTSVDQRINERAAKAATTTRVYRGKTPVVRTGNFADFDKHVSRDATKPTSMKPRGNFVRPIEPKDKYTNGHRIQEGWSRVRTVWTGDNAEDFLQWLKDLKTAMTTDEWAGAEMKIEAYPTHALIGVRWMEK